MNTLEALLRAKRQIIFTGPPGTGKTRAAKRLAYLMLKGELSKADVSEDDFNDKLKNLQNPKDPAATGAWDIIQFHPSYNYDDFVRGIRVSTNNNNTVYTTENGPLLKMADAARACSDKNFILIIDEINRANVAAVLGEMIYALEYRDEEVALQYAIGDDARTSLPKNLFIIGTMNSADRSIGHLDYAVRRRFAFKELLPKREFIDAYYPDGDLKTAALTEFDKVAALFTGESSKLTADYQARDVQPGHSYFLVKDQAELTMNLEYQIKPLLREYVADGVLKLEPKTDIDKLI